MELIKKLNAKHCLFDFDGTLVDSMPSWAHAMISILDENNIKYPDDVVAITTPLGLEEVCKYFRSLGLKKSNEEIEAHICEYLTPKYVDEIVPKKYVVDKLKELRTNGIATHILTASPHVWVDPCLVRNGMYGLFDDIWSTDDFKMTKNEPEIYKKAAKLIGADIGEIAFFDDNTDVISASSKSGIITVGVYDDTGKTYEGKIRSTANAYIYDFSQI